MGDELSGRLREVYRDLHAHPELSFEEHRTAGIAAGWLRDLDFEVIEGIARTGVAGVLRNGDPGPGSGRRALTNGSTFNEWGFIEPPEYFSSTAAAVRAAFRR
jgi:hypothetical protein